MFNATVICAQSDFRLGANLDPVISWFSPVTSGIDRDGSKPGFNAGLIVEYYFSKNYAFVSGLSLTSLAGNLFYKEAVSITTGAGEHVLLPAGSTVAFNLSYLTLPAGLKLKTNEIGYFTYFAQVGFSPQINIGSRATATGSLLKKDNISKEINLFNLSYFFGGGLEYDMGGQTSLLAGLFFNNGFVDILSNNRYKTAFNYLTIRLGIMF